MRPQCPECWRHMKEQASGGWKCCGRFYSDSDALAVTVDGAMASVGHMRRRLESGQGEPHDAMCRLGLTQAEALVAEIKRLERRLGRAELYVRDTMTAAMKLLEDVTNEIKP